MHPLRKSIPLALLIAGCLLHGADATSQSRWSWDISGGISTPGVDQTYLRNWGSGWVASLGGAYSMNSHLQALVSISYHRFGFEGGYPGYSIYDSPVAAADPSTLFQAYGGLRCLPVGRFFRPYVTAGVGYESLHLGKVLRSTSTVQGAGGTFTDSRSDISTEGGYAAAGLGLMIPTPLNVHLLVEGDFVTTFDGKHTFLPLTLGIETAL